MSLKKGTEIFIVVDNKVVKGKVTRVGQSVINVKAGGKSLKCTPAGIFKKEVSALRHLSKMVRVDRSLANKNLIATRKTMRVIERTVKRADKQLTTIKTRIVKAAA